MGSKHRGVLWGALALVLIFVAGASLYGSQPHTSVVIPVATFSTRAALVPKAVSYFSLVTEPQDGMAPVEQLIEGASSSIDVVMYEFEDTQLEQLLSREQQKGIAVRVILDNGYFGAGSAVNEEAFDYFQNNNVQVRWSPDYFALTHEKSLVVDGKEALIMTFNFSPQYYKSDRDFGLIDTDASDVEAIEQAFDEDWNGQNVSAQSGDDLVWSPGSRTQLLRLINSATSSLDIYNEEMQDPQIISALESAAKRGVTVEVDMTAAANWNDAFQQLSDTGVQVRTYAANAPLYIHAKVVIADGSEAFVGSENFSSTSLDQNRELGIIVTDPSVVATLSRIFTQDRQGAAPFLVQ